MYFIQFYFYLVKGLLSDDEKEKENEDKDEESQEDQDKL